MDKGKLSQGANLLRLSTLGINFALTIFVGLGLGWAAQKIFHLGDWAMLAGLLFGIVASYVRLIGDLKALRNSTPVPPSRKPPPEP